MGIWRGYRRVCVQGGWVRWGVCREVCGTQEVCGLCQEVCGLELTTRPDVWPDKGGPRLEERDGNSSSCPCLCVPVHGGPSPGCEPTEAGREGPVQVVPATGMCRPARHGDVPTGRVDRGAL